MPVGPAEAKRTDAHPARGVPGSPLYSLPGKMHRQVVPGDVRVGLVNMKRFGNSAMLEREDRLQHAADPRCALGVSHIGLNGADDDGVLRRSALTIHRRERLHLNGVSQRRPGAVTLHIVNA